MLKLKTRRKPLVSNQHACMHFTWMCHFYLFVAFQSVVSLVLRNSHSPLHHSVETQIKAILDAIEFDQIPALGDLVPDGRDAMKVDVLVLVPPKFLSDLMWTSSRPLFRLDKYACKYRTEGWQWKMARPLRACRTTHSRLCQGDSGLFRR